MFNTKNGVFQKILGIFNEYSIPNMFGNLENSLFPNGYTECPKIIFPEFPENFPFLNFRIPEAKKIENDPTLGQRALWKQN